MKFGLGSRKKRTPPTTLESLSDTNIYPVMNARELIAILGIGSRISTIKRHASVSPSMYKTHYEAFIHTFLEAAQLQPASATDHHAGLGGLITHTLEVVESAMAMRRALLLPVNGIVEQIAREELSWTYGVFVAAMLHDAGKLLTLTRLVPTNDVPFTPLSGTIMDTDADSYRIEWASGEMVTGVNTLYELQTRISVSMLTMLPKEGLTMIGSNISILKEITAYLSDLPYEWGTIGKLCRDADMRSVSEDMQPGVNRAQVPSAPTVSLAKRMVQALRDEVKRLSVPLNKDGATAWVTDDAVWLVCKVGARRIRGNLEDNGSTDIPNDDTRIYSILLDHGYIIPTPEGEAIWNVRVQCEKYDHALTMLKFPRSSVIHPSRQIKPFDGAITPITRDELVELRDSPAQPPRPTPTHIDPETVDSDMSAHSDEPQMEAESDSDIPHPGKQPSTPKEPPSPAENLSAPVPSKSENAEPPAVVSPPTGVSKKKKNRLVKELTDEELKPATVRVAETLNASVIKKRSDLLQEPVELSHEHIGRYFLTWVRNAIDSNHINLDSGRPPIHVISDDEEDSKDAQTLALISWPSVGHNFMQNSGLETSDDKELKKKASNRIRKSLKEEGLILTRPKRYDIWQAQFPTRAGMTSSTMFCLVAPAWTLFDAGELPEFNKDLTLRHGDYDPNHRPVKAGHRK